jgi:DNA-binding beta-propeller fold protein YncE
MKTRTVAVSLGALLAVGLGTAALSQQGDAPAQPSNANVVGTGPIVQPARARPATPLSPAAAAAAAARGSNSNPQPLLGKPRRLVYIALPGSLERPIFPSGYGIVVLDADANYAFVKRIPVWSYAAGVTPEDISGMAASPATNMIYVSARGHLAAIDLATEKMVWSTAIDGHCCERPLVSPDGKTLIVNSNLQDYTFKIDAWTGKVLAKIEAPTSPNMHNVNLSPDGKLAFMSPNGKQLTIADTATAKAIRTITFPDNVRVQVLNKDASKIYVGQNNFLGYIIADTRTGEILKTVEVTSVDWRKVWNATPRPRVGHGCPSHGIAITQDGKEVWLADGLFHKIHIFSNDDNPKEIATIDTPNDTFWLTPSVDGKLFYSSSGDIIDIASRKIIGVTKDEYGNRLFSEKELEMIFQGGRLVRASNQFGNEYGDFVKAEELGVGPHFEVPTTPVNLLLTQVPDPNASWAPKPAAATRR